MYKNYIKSVLDILVASVAILLLSPVLVVVAALVLLIEGRPVFFRQRRVGRYGKLFSIYKFRTMTLDKASHLGSFDVGSKSRVTWLGSALRQYKIDELPQLINVLKGEMSLIGPRPEISAWTQVYPEKWQKVLEVKPGITDWASIMFRDEEKMLANSADPQKTYRTEILPTKLEYYLDYSADIKFSKDIIILYNTIKMLVRKSQ